MTRLQASVLVCTHNRAALLEDCLRSILADRSTIPREVVVVDNGSSDATAEVVRAIAAGSGLPVRYVLEPRLGTSHARNTAVREARADYLLFTDDDALVTDGWADALVAGFDDPSVAAVGGRIVPRWPVEPPAWMDGRQALILTMHDYGTEPRLLGPDEHAITKNLAVRGDLVRSLDPPFHPRLGYSGRHRVAGEDTYLVNRLRRLGTVAYRPDALVHRVIQRDRMDLAWMRTAHFHQGIAMARLARIEGEPPRSLRNRIYWAVRSYARARALRRRNDRVEREGPGTWDEFFAYLRAGYDLEMLVGRSARASDWVVRRGV